jgi:hypothetical protein
LSNTQKLSGQDILKKNTVSTDITNTLCVHTSIAAVQTFEGKQQWYYLLQYPDSFFGSACIDL